MVITQQYSHMDRLDLEKLTLWKVTVIKQIKEQVEETLKSL